MNVYVCMQWQSNKWRLVFPPHNNNIHTTTTNTTTVQRNAMRGSQRQQCCSLYARTFHHNYLLTRELRFVWRLRHEGG